MSDPIPVISYRSAGVPEPAGEWAVGPGTLRVTLAPAGRWLAGAAAAVRLLAILIVAGMIAAAFVSATSGTSRFIDTLVPLAAVVGMVALVMRASATLVRVVQERRGPSVIVESGVFTMADPARTAGRVRIGVADVVGISATTLGRPTSSGGVVRVRADRADGQRVTYDLRTGDARCGPRLEAELRRVLQLTPPGPSVSTPV